MAGRKRKNEGELRVPVCFSLSPATKKKAQELRAAGYKVNDIVEALIVGTYNACVINGVYRLLCSAYGIENQGVEDPADLEFGGTK